MVKLPRAAVPAGRVAAGVAATGEDAGTAVGFTGLVVTGAAEGVAAGLLPAGALAKSSGRASTGLREAMSTDASLLPLPGVTVAAGVVATGEVATPGLVAGCTGPPTACGPLTEAGEPLGATSSVRVCSSRSGAGGISRLTVWSASLLGGVLENIIGTKRTNRATRTAAPSRRVFKESSIRPTQCESRRL